MYDHEKGRYDHHQKGFEETFDGKMGIKLSSMESGKLVGVEMKCVEWS